MKKAERIQRAARARALLFGSQNEANTSNSPAGGESVHANSPKRGSAASGSRQAASPSDAAAAACEAAAVAHTKLTVCKWTQPPAPGDIVFWRGERMFVEPPVPKSLLESPWIRIGDHRIPVNRPIDKSSGQPIPLNELYKDRNSFYVHADELTPMPADFNHRATRLPTLASVARAKRAAEGARDVGDEIAETLRTCADLEAVYDAASEYLAVSVADLKARYGKLNPGQQRMNLGNRMRFKWRKEHV